MYPAARVYNALPHADYCIATSVAMHEAEKLARVVRVFIRPEPGPREPIRLVSRCFNHPLPAPPHLRPAQPAVWSFMPSAGVWKACATVV